MRTVTEQIVYKLQTAQKAMRMVYDEHLTNQSKQIGLGKEGYWHYKENNISKMGLCRHVDICIIRNNLKT